MKGLEVMVWGTKKMSTLRAGVTWSLFQMSALRVKRRLTYGIEDRGFFEGRLGRSRGAGEELRWGKRSNVNTQTVMGTSACSI